MSSHVLISIRKWDDQKAWLKSTAYSAPWFAARLVDYGLGRREAKKLARQFERRECFPLPALQAKCPFDIESMDSFARQLGDVGAIVEFKVIGELRGSASSRQFGSE